MSATSVIFFFSLAAVLLYIVAGYPLLLAWLAGRRPRPSAGCGQPQTVSFIIAVHNGERFLAVKLQSILDLDYPPDLMQIIVVSDGSTDRTTEIASDSQTGAFC